MQGLHCNRRSHPCKVMHQLMQPLSARCMRTLLRYRVVAHSLPAVMGRRTGVPASTIAANKVQPACSS